MKILNKAEFLKLPEGIIYCKGKRWHFGGLSIKGDTCNRAQLRHITADGCEPNDWYEINVTQIEHHDNGEFFDRLEEMLTTDKSYPLEIAACRNGLFEDDDLFCVYEKADLEILATALQACKGYDEVIADNSRGERNEISE